MCGDALRATGDRDRERFVIVEKCVRASLTVKVVIALRFSVVRAVVHAWSGQGLLGLIRAC